MQDVKGFVGALFCKRDKEIYVVDTRWNLPDINI